MFLLTFYFFINLKIMTKKNLSTDSLWECCHFIWNRFEHSWGSFYFLKAHCHYRKVNWHSRDLHFQAITFSPDILLNYAADWERGLLLMSLIVWLFCSFVSVLILENLKYKPGLYDIKNTLSIFGSDSVFFSIDI